MSSILTNNGAMVALQTMKSINKDLGGIQDMISTGKKVANAKDNAAVWAISTTMEADVSSFKAVSDSLALGQSTVAVARNATEEVTELLQEMQTKIISAQEENVDRNKIQDDVDALRDQITSIVGAAQFNGLNLLKGTDDVNILGSLDRDSGGNITTSDITVSRNNLETTASAFGTTSTAETAATSISNNVNDTGAGGSYEGVTDRLDVRKSVDYTLATIDSSAALTQANDDTSLSMNVNGQTYTVHFDDTVVGINDANNIYLDADNGIYDASSVMTNFFTMINNDITSSTGNLNGTGITISDNGSGTLTIHTQRSATTNVSMTESGETHASLAVAGNTSNGADLVSGNQASTDLGSGTVNTVIRDNTNRLTLNAGDPAAGTSYQVTLGQVGSETEYRYVAKESDTLNDVAAGLKAQIDAAGVTGLTVSVNTASDSTVNDVTLDFNFTDTTNTTNQTFTVQNFSGGTAGGGLEELANIDVTSEASATAALVHIKGLIDTSIDAAAAFGSDEKRLEIQQDFIGKLTDSMTAGIGSMVDANMEETAARLQALQVQQQLGTQALSIANQAPQNILALFR